MMSPRIRRRRRLGLALLAALAAPGPAAATLLVYEPFDYPAETVLDGVAATGQNLTGVWTPLGTIPFQKLVVSEPGLGYGALVGAPAAAGGKADDPNGVTAAGGTVSVDADVAIAPGDAIFFSALFTFDDSLNGNHLAQVSLIDDATGNEIGFGQPSVGGRALRVSAFFADQGQVVADSLDQAFENGQSFFLVGRYLNGAAPDSDVIQLLAYDTADADVLPGSFDPADPGAEHFFELTGLGLDLAQISSLNVTIRGTRNNFVDELRIGTAYASVALAAEPAAVTLLGLGALTLGAVRRSRA